MKPFDLEKAIAGEPIVTRDGREAKFIAHVPDLMTHPIIVVIKGKLIQMLECGKWCSDEETITDLFMAPKKRTVWVNFYDWTNANYFDSETEANDESACGRIGGKAYPVEIEE